MSLKNWMIIYRIRFVNDVWIIEMCFRDVADMPADVSVKIEADNTSFMEKIR